jgi:hypothetical protein
VQYPFGLKIDVGDAEMIIISNELDKLYRCTIPRSELFLENCFEVKNSEKLLKVDGCNIDIKIYNFEEHSQLSKYSFRH